jgi:hypothetical protein
VRIKIGLSWRAVVAQRKMRRKIFRLPSLARGNLKNVCTMLVNLRKF